MCRNVRSSQIHDITFPINKAYCWTKIFTRTRSIYGVQHRNVGQAG